MPHATADDIEQAATAPQHGMASEADVLPEQSFTAGAKEFGSKMNPVSIAQGIAQNVYHPIEAIKRWGDVNNRLLSNAEDAAKRGDYTEAAAHALHYVLNGIPGLGEALDEAGTKMREGDITGGLADTAALGTQIIAGAKAPAIARGIGTAGQYTAAAAKTAAPGVLGGMAKAGAGEVLAKLPGMELPARFGLQYPALRQVAKAIEKGHEAGMKAVGPKAAPLATEAAQGATAATAGPARASEAQAAATAPPTSPVEPEAPASTAPGKTAADLLNEEMGTKQVAPQVTAKAPGQTLAESYGEHWGKLSEDDKLSYAHLEGAQATAEARNAAAPSAFTPRPPEYYGVKPNQTPPTAAEVPPQVPQSAPAPVQPASAAPRAATVEPIITPEPTPAAATPPTPRPASRAQTAAAQAKADRFVTAIRKFNSDNPQQALSADELAGAGDAEKGMLTRGLQQGGYIKNTEKFPDTSFPYIVSKLKDAEAAASQTIKPPAGFSLGAFKRYPPEAASPAPSAIDSTPAIQQNGGMAQAAAEKEPWQMTQKEYLAKQQTPPEVAQPTPLKRVSIETQTLSGSKHINAKTYALPGYRGPTLAVQEYKTPRGPGYRVYMAEGGQLIQDNNGVSSLNDTLKTAVQRVSVASSKTGVQPQLLPHYAAIKDALVSGKPVPPEILADYPSLKPAEAPAHAAPQPAATGQAVRPSLGDTGRDIYQGWKSLAEGPQPPRAVIEGFVPGVGRFDFRNGQIVRLFKQSGKSGTVSTYEPATKADIAGIHDAIDKGQFQVEQRTISGAGGVRKFEGAGALEKVFHQATGQPLPEFLATPEGAAWWKRINR